MLHQISSEIQNKYISQQKCSQAYLCEWKNFKMLKITLISIQKTNKHSVNQTQLERRKNKKKTLPLQLHAYSPEQTV